MNMRLVVLLADKPIRMCQSMHACGMCDRSIVLGELYRDGGLNKRAHKTCFDAAAALMPQIAEAMNR